MTKPTAPLDEKQPDGCQVRLSDGAVIHRPKILSWTSKDTGRTHDVGRACSCHHLYTMAGTPSIWRLGDERPTKAHVARVAVLNGKGDR